MLVFYMLTLINVGLLSFKTYFHNFLNILSNYFNWYPSMITKQERGDDDGIKVCNHSVLEKKSDFN